MVFYVVIDGGGRYRGSKGRFGGVVWEEDFRKKFVWLRGRPDPFVDVM